MTNSPNLNQLLQVSLDDIKREKARRHLKHFTTYTFPQYVLEPFHELVADTLDHVITGAIDRLMIFSPPQSGKSLLASIMLPSFWFGKKPDNSIIISSYGATLAYSKSKQARNIVESIEYADIFPNIKTDPASRARDNWSVAGHKGELVAAGVGGAITGRGCLLGIIDDPFESWEQAQSQTYRDRVWEWYRNTFRTRIREGGRILIINTRWHEDDLCGRLLEDQGDLWQVLRFPALAETQEERDKSNDVLGLPKGQSDPLGRKPGQALCPKRFSRDTLLRIKRDVGSMGWYAEYQGVPRAPSGNRFKRDWFEIVDAVPAKWDGLIRAWDKAATEGDGDYTAGVLIGVKDGTYYVLSCIRGQWSTGNREKVLLQTAQLDMQDYGRQVKIWHETEPGSSGIDSSKATTINLAGFPVFSAKSTGSKEVRIEPFAAQAEAGNVKLLKGDWNKEYIDELCSFPSGTHDDMVDASSLAFNNLPRKRKAKVRLVQMH